MAATLPRQQHQAPFRNQLPEKWVKSGCRTSAHDFAMPVRKSKCFCCSRKSGDKDGIYSDLIADTKAARPVRFFPASENELDAVDDNQVRSLMINSRDDASAESFLQSSTFPNLDHCEIRLSKGLNIKKATPFLLRHHRTLQTAYLRCVAPGRTNRAQDGRDPDGVHRSIRNLLETCTQLTCLGVSIGSSDFPSANFDIPGALATGLRFARGLRVLKLGFQNFDEFNFQECDLDLHTIELEERTAWKVTCPNSVVPIDLSKMRCLEKVAVASPRPLILSEENTSLRKLVLSHVRSVQGNVSGMVILNISYCSAEIVRRLFSSTKDSLRELGLYFNGCAAEGSTYSIGSRRLRVLFLDGLIFAKVKTYRKRPLDVLYMARATLSKDQDRLYAKQVLIEGTATFLDSALPLIDPGSIKSLALQDLSPSSLMSAATLLSIKGMQNNLKVFASNYALPSGFPQLPNMKRFFGLSAACVEKLHTDTCTSLYLASCCSMFKNKLDLIGLTNENANDIDSVICTERAERRLIYESAKHFFYESLDRETSLISDVCWTVLASCWHSLLSAGRQRGLVSHGAITRSASTSTEDDMHQR